MSTPDRNDSVDIRILINAMLEARELDGSLHLSPAQVASLLEWIGDTGQLLQVQRKLLDQFERMRKLWENAGDAN